MSHIAGKENIYDTVTVLEEHVHTSSECYPTLASGVTVTGAAGAWTNGAYVEIIPANTVTSDFDIHFVSIEDMSANDVYELELAYGAGDTHAGCIRLVKSVGNEATQQIPVQTPIIPKNSRVRARVATAGGGSDTVDIALLYHIY